MSGYSERFMSKVLGEPNSGCWLWMAGIATKGLGYGRFQKRDKQPELAHRVSWEIHKGAIPDRMNVLHKCDTPSCVNPHHLFLGTQADNVADMVAKGRSCDGERSGVNKVTNEQVIEIRASDDIPRIIARRYGIAIRTVRSIKDRSRWKHI